MEDFLFHCRAAVVLVCVTAALASMKPAEMLLMPVGMIFIFMRIGHMLTSLYSINVVDLSCFFASAAVGVAPDAPEHVPGGDSDPSGDVLCELHQLCDAELAHDVVHVVQLIARHVAGCCRAIFPCAAAAAHVAEYEGFVYQ